MTTVNTQPLRVIEPALAARRRTAGADAATLSTVQMIVDDVSFRGWPAVLEHSVRLGDAPEGSSETSLILDRPQLKTALDALPRESRRVLEAAADRIAAFAASQRACLSDLETIVPGGIAGHSIAPVQRAGCYAPGGRFPLPSSVLMTAVTARAAGVNECWVASPRPAPVTLAAAAIAGADGLLAVGGAQAIAALAFGAGSVPPCDLIVGPGNRFVTAAKRLVAGVVGIDMLAGPSELLIIADDSADPAVIAADLLAQAEHDEDASAILVCLDAKLVGRVQDELVRQLETLPTAATARVALRNGFATIVATTDQAVEIADAVAPEHLQVMTRDSGGLAGKLRNYGGLFIGTASAEVFGDYGLGPNHVLPTGGTARYTAGLSVFTFMRARTFLKLDALPAEIARDTATLARLEGLEGHARAAEARLRK